MSVSTTWVLLLLKEHFAKVRLQHFPGSIETHMWTNDPHVHRKELGAAFGGNRRQLEWCAFLLRLVHDFEVMCENNYGALFWQETSFFQSKSSKSSSLGSQTFVGGKRSRTVSDRLFTLSQRASCDLDSRKAAIVHKKFTGRIESALLRSQELHEPETQVFVPCMCDWRTQPERLRLLFYVVAPRSFRFCETWKTEMLTRAKKQKNVESALPCWHRAHLLTTWLFCLQVDTELTLWQEVNGTSCPKLNLFLFRRWIHCVPDWFTHGNRTSLWLVNADRRDSFLIGREEDRLRCCGADRSGEVSPWETQVCWMTRTSTWVLFL